MDASNAPLLDIVDAVAGYGKQDVLRGLTLQVASGEIYALLGANGAGKTTTISLLLGFVQARTGRVRVGGIDPTADAAGARRQIAYIPENVALYEHLSAYENLSYLLDLAGQPTNDDAVREALSAAGLARAAHDRRAAGFSKGMRQKVAIALALARQVPALLLDEPTSGLDPQASAEFSRLLGDLRTRGVAVLMVTHDLLGAVNLADRIGFLLAGKLAEEVSAAGPERFDVRALHRHYAAAEDRA